MAARKSRKTAPKADAWLDLEAQGSTLSPVYDPTRGLGLETRYTSFRPIREIGSEEIRGLYSDGIGRRIVELPVDLALRTWPLIDVDPEYQEQAERVAEAGEALDMARWIRRAAIWARRDGWSLSIQGWTTAGDLQPWNEPRRPVGADLLWIRPAYRWDCANPTDYFGPDSAHFGEARWISVYRMRPDVEGDIGYLWGSDLGTVHGSRFTRLSTTTGRTEYERVAQYLAQLLAGGGGVAGALSRANVGVFSIPDWAQKVRRNDAEAYGRIRSHFEALSSFAPLVLDAGSNGRDAEKFEMLANGALGGTENALFALSWLVSAAAPIPMVELFGLEPSGFSSGEETTRRFHDSLEQIRRWAEPAIRSVYDGLWARELGRPSIPPYRLVWAPIRSPSLEERTTLTAGLLAAAEKSISLGLTTPAAVQAGLAQTPEADLWAWGPAPAAQQAPQAAPEVEDAEEPPAVPPPGTWLEAEEAAERSGIAARKIKSLGSRGIVHRRKLGSRWEYRLEDLIEAASAAVEGPSVAEEEEGPVEDEDPDEYVARAYRAYHEAVNMSAKEMREWAETECSGAASLSRDPIWRNVRLLETPREKWTVATARSAMRTVSFVARMRGAENGPEVCGGWSKREISLRNWAHNPRA